ncbi:hypothetical protein ACKI10_06880 [Streptomyces galilaeus]|uniref:hypothetical protein n=1 Tax=Streptomyces galilaeus TaxID=33899 RepID=UPI0038F80245
MQNTQRTPLAHLLMEGVPLPSNLDHNELVAIYSVKGETFVEPFVPGDSLQDEDEGLVLICHESEVLGLTGRPADAFPFMSS